MIKIYFLLNTKSSSVSRDLAVLDLSSVGNISLEREICFAKRPRIDDLTSALLRAKRVKLVSDDYEIRQRIESECGVVVPVDWTGVERKGRQMTLGNERFGKMRRNLARFWKVDAVAAHLGDDVFSKEDYLLRAILDPTRIRRKNRRRDEAPKFVSDDTGRYSGSGKDVGESGICRTGDENKL